MCARLRCRLRASVSLDDAMTFFFSTAAQVQYGRWLIDGYPKVLLFDIGSAWNRLGEWRADFSRITGIPLPEHDKETNDAVVFGYLVAWFFGTVRTSSRAALRWPTHSARA